MRDPDARRDRLRAAGPWVLDGLLALAACSRREAPAVRSRLAAAEGAVEDAVGG